MTVDTDFVETYKKLSPVMLLAQIPSLNQLPRVYFHVSFIYVYKIVYLHCIFGTSPIK